MGEPAEQQQLDAARHGDAAAFRTLTERHRRELVVHCYRFVGNLEDAEDLVQEVFLRAWQRLASFEGRSSLRTWLYRIATNASLDAIDRRPPRILPHDAGPPAPPQAPLRGPALELPWLGPIPSALLVDCAVATDVAYTMRESVSLAFLAALQRLPARQRAAVILFDVIGWQVEEVAELLELSAAAVQSLLARARGSLKKGYARAPALPSDEERALLDRYVRAWELGDVAGLVALMREDATMAMPPLPSWYLGRVAIADFVRASIFVGPGAGVKIRPTEANGAPALAFYRRSSDGEAWSFLGVQLVELMGAEIAGVVTYVGEPYAERFGLSPALA